MVAFTTEESMTERESRQLNPLPQARILLPPLSADYALTLVHILERIAEAIWRAHGDAMADLQAARGIETPRPWDADWVCPNPHASDDDDIF